MYLSRQHYGHGVDHLTTVAVFFENVVFCSFPIIENGLFLFIPPENVYKMLPKMLEVFYRATFAALAISKQYVL